MLASDKKRNDRRHNILKSNANTDKLKIKQKRRSFLHSNIRSSETSLGQNESSKCRYRMRYLFDDNCQEKGGQQGERLVLHPQGLRLRSHHARGGILSASLSMF